MARTARDRKRLSRAAAPALIAAVLTAVWVDAGARVSEEAAARLGAELTPVGAQRAGDAEGMIPPWTGGLAAPPPCFQGPGTRYCDPFPEDRPYATITAANIGEYDDHLSPGQIELLRRFPDSYRMPLYRTRRSFANPEFVYAATRANAVRAELLDDGDSLKDAVTGVPFPIPADGREVIWNHKTRYREPSTLRWNNQFAVTTGGEYSHTQFREKTLFAYGWPGAAPEHLDNVLMYFLQVVTRPERLAGSILLVHETLDRRVEAPRVWQYSPGQRRLRRAPTIAYDAPASGADGLRTNDQFDGFSGALDRYDWKLLGKRELFVPANSYRLHSDSLRYAEILRKDHIDPALTRYELRRVWVVEASLKGGASHQYRRRRFYLDEDGWQIRVVDVYDQRDRLWRLQEMHSVIAYDKPYELVVCETVYDLQNKRYLALALNNEEPETATLVLEVDDFDPGSVSRLAKE
ncbi:MAG: DUF1329 domain-containing protein [Pseudomonadota bacterium]